MSDKRPNPVQFRDQIIESALSARQSGGESPGMTACRDLDRYYTLLARALGMVSLAPNEALAICDALNGSRMDATSAAFLWAEIADALPDGLAAKWDIDGPALVARLRALTPAQSLAIVDAVERWWRLPEEAGDNEDRLRAVGLIR